MEDLFASVLEYFRLSEFGNFINNVLTHFYTFFSKFVCVFSFNFNGFFVYLFLFCIYLVLRLPLFIFFRNILNDLFFSITHNHNYLYINFSNYMSLFFYFKSLISIKKNIIIWY